MDYYRYGYSDQIITAMAMALLPFIIGLIIMGIITRKLARKKGYEGYFWTGFFLNIVGLIYVAGLPDNRGSRSN
jgi:uncharacterized membrane protein